MTEVWGEVAGRLRRAEASRQAIAPVIEGWPTLTIADGYNIQRVNIDRRIAAGEHIVGHKVGLSSKAMQRMMGVDEPDFGHLLASMQVAPGGVMDVDQCIQPRVEVEVAFVLGTGLRGPDCSIDDVLAATEAFHPAIEIIDSRIVDWRIGIVDTIADNASSKAFVLGDPVDPAALDPRMVPVVLSVNGDIAETGVSAAVLGHPATAVAWLANTLHPFGVTLEAGHVILPGSCTRAVPVAPGDQVVAEFGPLGDVAVTFDSIGVTP
jgi:2-keto-4-pentenoate hydratase